ncbi:hypothetical protein BDP27DRAFT_1361239 [Rhodocollybia butyracea]|uniref:Uncharacterized protein n=1 Tax=Rhodocollybia butyracea TaxID=206335 RepID=A0A9P5Q241_9AGAR|nr:hypothetical protein BDP27DRAFT_1361239 [Rhodocollybia butyracea]
MPRAYLTRINVVMRKKWRKKERGEEEGTNGGPKKGGRKEGRKRKHLPQNQSRDDSYSPPQYTYNKNIASMSMMASQWEENQREHVSDFAHIVREVQRGEGDHCGDLEEADLEGVGGANFHAVRRGREIRVATATARGKSSLAIVSGSFGFASGSLRVGPALPAPAPALLPPPAPTLLPLSPAPVPPATWLPSLGAKAGPPGETEPPLPSRSGHQHRQRSGAYETATTKVFSR